MGKDTIPYVNANMSNTGARSVEKDKVTELQILRGYNLRSSGLLAGGTWNFDVDRAVDRLCEP